ncbi:hypothetical protein ACLOJK_015272 [Asimina triloba]
MNHRSNLQPLHTSLCFSSSPPSRAGKPATSGGGAGAGGAGGGRDWAQIYAIYGMEESHTLLFLLFHALAFCILSLLLFYFTPFALFLQAHLLPSSLPLALSRFVAGLVGCISAISALSLFFASANIFYSSISLHWEMAQRMLASVTDWSTVKTALDIGCGRGILLNSVALMLKKQGSSGRVVGLERRKTLATLRTAGMEGVQEYVTCREGDARRLPFADNYFDVVVSGVHLHTVGKEYGQRTAAAAAERGKALGEVVRVLKPGGVGVVWDLMCVQEYVHRLQELRMEEIRVSERITAYMVSSQIVSFRKPTDADAIHPLVLDWRGNVLS